MEMFDCMRAKVYLNTIVYMNQKFVLLIICVLNLRMSFSANFNKLIQYLHGNAQKRELIISWQ